jgi:hypothetical protein
VAEKLILVVIDGLTPGMLERGVAEGRLPALSYLVEHGTYARGVTTFPSVTPVCLTSIATGAHPDVHHVPHLSWYHRGERRLVEYGSSFYAMRAVGTRRALRDSIFEMNHAHLSPAAATVFEAIEDAGLVPASINFTAYRGRTRHPIRLPGLASRRNRWYEAVYGPRRFFFFNLFESDVTGAPLAVRSRVEGSTDAYAGFVGRWLVTRDGFDFLVFYLPDFDYASHLTGPASPLDALARADASVAQLMDAAGGPDELLERYAVIVCSDHGQTHVSEAATLQHAYSDLRVLTPRRPDPDTSDVAVTASNRSGMVYRLEACPVDVRSLAERLDDEPAADVVLFREGPDAVARRAGEELRFRPGDGGFRSDGDPGLLTERDYPNGLERAWRALSCPNAGDVIVSAREGWELTDLGGRHHVGGGSHGSLAAGDSTVPILAAGFARPPLPERPGVTELAPLALAHFGIDPPPSMRAPVREPVRA